MKQYYKYSCIFSFPEACGKTFLKTMLNLWANSLVRRAVCWIPCSQVAGLIMTLQIQLTTQVRAFKISPHSLFQYGSTGSVVDHFEVIHRGNPSNWRIAISRARPLTSALRSTVWHLAQDTTSHINGRYFYYLVNVLFMIPLYYPEIPLIYYSDPMMISADITSWSC